MASRARTARKNVESSVAWMVLVEGEEQRFATCEIADRERATCPFPPMLEACIRRYENREQAGVWRATGVFVRLHGPRKE